MRYVYQAGRCVLSHLPTTKLALEEKKERRNETHLRSHRSWLPSLWWRACVTTSCFWLGCWSSQHPLFIWSSVWTYDNSVPAVTVFPRSFCDLIRLTTRSKTGIIYSIKWQVTSRSRETKNKEIHSVPSLKKAGRHITRKTCFSAIRYSELFYTSNVVAMVTEWTCWERVSRMPALA